MQDRFDEDRQQGLLDLVASHSIAAEGTHAVDPEPHPDWTQAPDVGEAATHEQMDLDDIEEEIWQQEADMNLSDAEDDDLVGAGSMYHAQAADNELDEDRGGDES